MKPLGYLAVWKVLEEMITDFKKKGVPVPANVLNDLKYAKTLISVLKADTTRLETSQKIEDYLNNIEAYLISEAQKFGDKYVDEWVKRLEDATGKIFEEEEETRFVPGLPREQRWIRVKPSVEMPIEALKALADELNLSFEVQKDGYLLVYGEDERLKDFVKKMATKYGSKTGK